MRDPLLGLIGLAARAGKIVYGADPTLDAVGKGKKGLILLASDAGETTRIRMKNLSESTNTPLRIYQDKFTLGSATGKTEKAVLFICDPHFASEILKRIDMEVSYG